ncbi:hypothetical protein GIB67_005778 [Kingdonia uniflora]|uniref:PHD-type domain-containing protein n=1 Tax=Kingdonia uniflora TaxID=39325 RepID=A0A7J7KVJ7_9MAGN|nr:hypothetical protein GIB67_005778 [Kingdonia uniflora]
MAKEEFVLLSSSGGRSGLKREFAFALEAHSQVLGSIGRTRVRKLQSSPNSNGVLEQSNLKKIKISSPVMEDLNEGSVAKFETSKGENLKESKIEEMKVAVAEGLGGITGSNLDEPIVEEVIGETLVVGDVNCEELSTRSSLKPNVEAVEISEASATATSSGSSWVLDDACEKEEGTLVSPLRAPLTSNLEMKMSKKIGLNKIPSNVKELLQTGVLEGMTVNYRFRGKQKESSGIQGTVKGNGILCLCASCDGCQIVTAYEFERHAGSRCKYPSENIYLDNGNNLRAVLDAYKGAPFESMEATIQNVICSNPVKRQPHVCQSCKGPLLPSSGNKMLILCKSCLESKEPQESLECLDRNSRLAKRAKSCDLGSESKVPESTRSQGKLTKKDLRLHKLVFEEDVLPDGTELAYFLMGKKLLEGHKKGSGIFCNCCKNEVSASMFEAHAGCASRRKPYHNIYTSNGLSLHELSVSLSQDRNLSVSYNDDLCGICADDGDLLLCDGCPRAFHKDCVGLSSIPEGKWFCHCCQNMYKREKSCEYNVNAKAAGRVAGVDPIEQITKRCIRIIKTLETEVLGGCALCRSPSFSKLGFNPRTVIICDQCEKEYHVGCLKDHKMGELKKLPAGKWFCCSDCGRINDCLRKMIIKGSERLTDSISNLIKKKCGPGLDNDAELDIRWDLLSGKNSSLRSRSLLSSALAIFQDRFDPIVDSETGRDLIPSMVYGINSKDQEFGGMYCAILTVNSCVVSAGIIRILGVEVAEIPIVATSSDCQGKGYFQALFACMEIFLGFLNVRNIVLPAADEVGSIWTDKFGFNKMTHEQLNEFRRKYQMMVFQGTSMLHKYVPPVKLRK